LQAGEMRWTHKVAQRQGRNRLGAQKDGNESQQEHEHTTRQWNQPWNDVNNVFDGVDLALLLIVVLGGVRHAGS